MDDPSTLFPSAVPSRRSQRGGDEPDPAQEGGGVPLATERAHACAQSDERLVDVDGVQVPRAQEGLGEGGPGEGGGSAAVGGAVGDRVT
ncbi:hypothetical protein [Streptomyces sp. NPDC088789]|uniref:hypothetical protein n=1 Tax=Streptomyces sp. NPDC088789 TaxID=3365899 RepID=UPI0037FA326C